MKCKQLRDQFLESAPHPRRYSFGWVKDVAEGLQSFRERRSAKFKGR
jgi:hypothetical protein